MDGMSDALAEIEAMKSVASAIEELDSETQVRVLHWACDRYGVPGGQRLRRTERLDSSNGPGGSTGSSPERREFDSAAELLAESGAQTDVQKALAIGYWFQVVLGQSDIESQTINTELKHLGYGLSNVTRAFDNLMKQKPQPVIQLRKAGSSRQARKKYKLTNEGIKRVERMLAGISNGDDGAE